MSSTMARLTHADQCRAVKMCSMASIPTQGTSGDSGATNATAGAAAGKNRKEALVMAHAASASAGSTVGPLKWKAQPSTRQETHSSHFRELYNSISTQISKSLVVFIVLIDIQSSSHSEFKVVLIVGLEYKSSSTVSLSIVFFNCVLQSSCFESYNWSFSKEKFVLHNTSRLKL